MKATKTRLPMLCLSLERVFRINLFMTPYSPAALRDQNNTFILPNAPTSCVSCGPESGNRNNEGRKSTPKFFP